MESILAAAVTGVLTLIGVLISNTKSRSVMELKVDQLREQVERHNGVIERLYCVEKKVAVLENDVTTLYKRCDREEKHD